MGMEKGTLTGVTYLTIDEAFAGQRIDNFLVTKLKSLPKTRLYRLLRKGEIRVNKKRIGPDYRLQTGDIIRLAPMRLEEKPPAPRPGHYQVALLADRILYEDKNLLIINKPAGIPVHGGTKTSLGIIEILRNMYPKLPHLELAHRLDLGTSGCLILAKKRSTLKELHTLLREGKVHKVYLALTKGQWKKTDYRVDAPLRKNHMSSGERIVKVDPEGKPSLTVFKPIKSYSDSTLVEATLHTGRTHQIRVHSRYRQHPIAGDDKYGDAEFNKKMRQLGLKRLFLHSNMVEFTLPGTGEHIKVIAPLDADLQQSLDHMER
jgi:23S rRNA pseudouridine955/2504/2580 synthase